MGHLGADAGTKPPEPQSVGASAWDGVSIVCTIMFVVGAGVGVGLSTVGVLNNDVMTSAAEAAKLEIVVVNIPILCSSLLVCLRPYFQ